MKIKISTAAYNEIATALERLGVKADGSTELTLEKGTQLSCPIDFKMVTIRRDVAAIAKDCYKDQAQHFSGGLFTDFCDQLMTWVMTDKQYDKPEAKKSTKGWK